MTKPLIALPCTAREIETALHAVCDHGGLWDGQIELAPDNRTVFISSTEAFEENCAKKKGEPK